MIKETGLCDPSPVYIRIIHYMILGYGLKKCHCCFPRKKFRFKLPLLCHVFNHSAIGRDCIPYSRDLFYHIRNTVYCAARRRKVTRLERTRVLDDIRRVGHPAGRNMGYGEDEAAAGYAEPVSYGTEGYSPEYEDGQPEEYGSVEVGVVEDCLLYTSRCV